MHQPEHPPQPANSRARQSELSKKTHFCPWPINSQRICTSVVCVQRQLRTPFLLGPQEKWIILHGLKGSWAQGKLGCALGGQAGKCQQECPAVGTPVGEGALCSQTGTDPCDSTSSCQTGNPLSQKALSYFRAAVCGLQILGTTERKKIKRKRLFFFFRVYLAFDKQNDCHSSMCMLLDKYLCKSHRLKGSISPYWFKNKSVHLIVCSCFFQFWCLSNTFKDYFCIALCRTFPGIREKEAEGSEQYLLWKYPNHVEFSHDGVGPSLTNQFWFNSQRKHKSYQMPILNIPSTHHFQYNTTRLKILLKESFVCLL